MADRPLLEVFSYMYARGKVDRNRKTSCQCLQNFSFDNVLWMLYTLIYLPIFLYLGSRLDDKRFKRNHFFNQVVTIFCLLIFLLFLEETLVYFVTNLWFYFLLLFCFSNNFIYFILILIFRCGWSLSSSENNWLLQFQ